MNKKKTIKIDWLEVTFRQMLEATASKKRIDPPARENYKKRKIPIGYNYPNEDNCLIEFFDNQSAVAICSNYTVSYVYNYNDENDGYEEKYILNPLCFIGTLRG